MSQSLSFVLGRANATSAAMKKLSPGWEWEEKTATDLDADIEAFTDQQEILNDSEVATRGASGEYQADLDWLHENTVRGLKLSRNKYRNDPPKLARFRTVTADGGSRSLVYDEALKFESAWENADPNYKPVKTLTLAAFKARRLSALAKQKLLADAEGDEGVERARLNQQSEDLHAVLVAWYEAATAIFGEETENGQMIRSKVPTTYVPDAPPEPPKPVVPPSDPPPKTA